MDLVVACLADIMEVRTVQVAEVASDMIQVGEGHMEVIDAVGDSMVVNMVTGVQDHTVVETVAAEVNCMSGGIAGTEEHYSEGGIAP